MRTPKQGQAAVLEEREHRRREKRMPVSLEPGPWENISRTVTYVERYLRRPAVPPRQQGHPGFYHGRLQSAHGFLFFIFVFLCFVSI